jgi:multiple antibiotic resistance protein
MGLVTDTFLIVCAALFPMVNPIGGAPIFLNLTEDRTAEERGRLALWVAINSFLLLLGSLLIGSYVLDFFGISIPIVRIGGGFVLASLGWRLLNADPDPDHAAARNHRAETPESFYPLTLPLTVGPGCMAVAITLATQHPRGADLDHLLMFNGAVIAGFLLISLSVYLCYRYAARLISFLGHGGMSVVMRLTAFILMCIGIQVVWSGWTALQAAHP